MNSQSLPSSTLIQITEQPGSDVLIVAFTGRAAKFNAIKPFDFFQLTGLLGCHRILLREPNHYCYLKGIDDTGLDGLVARLQNEIARIAPKKVIFMGVSSGGYAALLYGHLLKADYVHAFSPFTYLDFSKLLRLGEYKSGLMHWPMAILRLNLLLPRKEQAYLDLRPLLMNDEGATQYNIHACAYSFDRTRATYLEGCPRTRVFLYPCANHNVVRGMIKSRCLKALLASENLHRTEEIYREFYPHFDPDHSACDACNGMKKESIAALKK